MDQIVEGIELDFILVNAPGKPVLWQGFLTELIRLLKCDSSYLLITNMNERENTHFFSSVGISDAYQQLYEDKLNKTDVFNYFISKNPLTAYCNQIEDNNGNITVDEKFLAPQGQGYRIGVSIPCNRNYSLSLIVNRQLVFDETEKRLAERVIQTHLSSLQEAILIEQRYKIESQLIYYGYNHFDGYIIIDKELNILFTDPVYSYAISQVDYIEIRENRFNIKKPVLKKRLLSSIKRGDKVVSINSQCHTCQITLIPITSLKNLYQWECYKNGFIVTLIQNTSNRMLERLIDLYELSQSEATCALNFMKTPSIQDVAMNTFRSQETIRNHIKRTMQKMDVHNQAELMKKLVTLASL